MGSIDNKNIEKLSTELDTLANNYQPLLLDIENTYISSRNNRVYFKIKTSDSLQKLHEEIITNFSSYFINNATKDQFIGNTIKNSSLVWTNSYSKESSFKNFSAHITLGYGTPKITYENISFTADRLVIGHMGTHCSCRKIIYETKLK